MQARQPECGLDLRRDGAEAQRLERWLGPVTTAYAYRILPLDQEKAHAWGRPKVPGPGNPLDQRIVATALIHDLLVLTRNLEREKPTGVGVLDRYR